MCAEGDAHSRHDQRQMQRYPESRKEMSRRGEKSGGEEKNNQRTRKTEQRGKALRGCSVRLFRGVFKLLCCSKDARIRRQRKSTISRTGYSCFGNSCSGSCFFSSHSGIFEDSVNMAATRRPARRCKKRRGRLNLQKCLLFSYF